MVAPQYRATLKALEELHPKEAPPTLLQPDNVASSAYQFSDKIVFEQLKTFSKHTAAGPSKMYQEHLLHAVECTAPDHSESALRAITRFVNTGSRGKFPSFVSKALCSASLTALSKKKGVRPIAVSEILRRLIAKCLVKEAKSEAIELFDSIQLWVGVSGGAEAIIHSTKRSSTLTLMKECFRLISEMPSIRLRVHTYCKQHAISYQVLQPSHIFATLSMCHYCIITPVFKVNRVFNKEIPWVHFSFH